MNSLKAPSLQSLMDSDRASNDSQYTDYNIQLDLEEVRTYTHRHLLIYVRFCLVPYLSPTKNKTLANSVFFIIVAVIDTFHYIIPVSPP